jgi:hypothetical protein
VQQVYHQVWGIGLVTSAGWGECFAPPKLDLLLVFDRFECFEPNFDHRQPLD